MKKNIYITLLIIDVALMVYTGYYVATKPSTPAVIVTATSTKEVSPPIENPPVVRTFPILSGKKIIVSETNPVGESLSTIAITTEGFASNTPLTLEKNKLTNFFLTDLNKDGFEEFIMITTAQGSGSYGEAIMFTTAKNQSLTPVTIPALTEEETQKGGLFEGYMGHDTFSVIDGLFVREFPIYTATGTNSTPTGLTKKILYTVTEQAGSYAVTFSKATLSSTTTPTKPSASLISTSWIWTSSYIVTESGVGLTTPAPAGEKFVLSFDKDMNVTSTTDCNTLSGKAVVDKNTLRFNPFAMTMMFCEGSEESAYVGLLSKTQSFSVNGPSLTLFLADKSKLTFKKK